MILSEIECIIWYNVLKALSSGTCFKNGPFSEKAQGSVTLSEKALSLYGMVLYLVCEDTVYE